MKATDRGSPVHPTPLCEWRVLGILHNDGRWPALKPPSKDRSHIQALNTRFELQRQARHQFRIGSVWGQGPIGLNAEVDPQVIEFADPHRDEMCVLRREPRHDAFDQGEAKRNGSINHQSGADVGFQFERETRTLK